MYLINSPLILQQILKKSNKDSHNTFENPWIEIWNKTLNNSTPKLKGILLLNNKIIYQVLVKNQNTITMTNDVQGIKNIYVIVSLNKENNDNFINKENNNNLLHWPTQPLLQHQVSLIENKKFKEKTKENENQGLINTLSFIEENENSSEKVKVYGTALKWEAANVDEFITEENIKLFNKNSFLLQFLNISSFFKENFLYNNQAISSNCIIENFIPFHFSSFNISKQLWYNDIQNFHCNKTTGWLKNTLNTAIHTVIKNNNLIDLSMKTLSTVDNKSTQLNKPDVNKSSVLSTSFNIENFNLSNTNYCVEMKKELINKWSTGLKDKKLMVFKAGLNKIQLNIFKDIDISFSSGYYEIRTKKPRYLLSQVTHAITHMYKRDKYHGKGIWKFGQQIKLKVRKKKS